MSLSNVILIISLTLLAIIIDITASKCVEETPCSCHLLDGSFYDLAKLSAEGPLNSTDTKFNYIASFQPCKNVKMTLGFTNKSDCDSDAGVSLCARLKDEKPFSLGTTKETTWNFVEEVPELILKHGTNVTRITLNCCAVCKSTTLILDSMPEPNNFHYLLNSQHACKIQGPGEGISTGSVLVILLFVFSGVYLLVGALALRFFRGAVGWELIPNYDFWSDLPALVRDGIAFTFSGCSADSYDRI